MERRGKSRDRGFIAWHLYEKGIGGGGAYCTEKKNNPMQGLCYCLQNSLVSKGTKPGRKGKEKAVPGFGRLMASIDGPPGECGEGKGRVTAPQFRDPGI